MPPIVYLTNTGIRWRHCVSGRSGRETSAGVDLVVLSFGPGKRITDPTCQLSRFFSHQELKSVCPALTLDKLRLKISVEKQIRSFFEADKVLHGLIICLCTENPFQPAGTKTVAVSQNFDDLVFESFIWR
jgi:hypothetical protein